jgi:hypothetical protein
MLDCIQPFCALRFIISDPWTTWGLEHWPSKQLKIPVKLIASPSYLWSPQTHGFNQPWVMWYYSIYYWKIAKYKWTCTIQSVVQRSAVYIFSFNYCLENIANHISHSYLSFFFKKHYWKFLTIHDMLHPLFLMILFGHI